MNTIENSSEIFTGFYRFLILATMMLGLLSDLEAQVVVDTFNLPSGYTSFQLRSKNVLKVDPSNKVWIGFKQIGSGVFDGTNWTMYNTTNGLPSNNVLSLAFLGNDVWFGTDNGLAKYNGSTWTVYDTSNSGLTSNSILSLFSDGGNLWIGTQSGAFVFDGSNWNHYTTGNSGLCGDTVNCFTKSGNDTIWMGTYNGLAKFYNGNWTTYTISDGLANNPITELVTDFDGDIWIQVTQQSQVHSYPCFVLRNDSIIQFNSFFSFCYSLPSSTDNLLIGLNNFGNVVTTGFFEVNLNPVNAWEVTVPLTIMKSVFDLDATGKVWFAPFLNPVSKLLLIDYHNSLSPVTSNTNCHTLDVNKVEAEIWNNGSMFWDLVGNARYEVPKGSGVNSIFADGFWIGGKDVTGGLHVAAQTYRQSGSDFWPGPLDTINGTMDTATAHQFDNIWKIDRLTVDAFITQFGLGNVTNGSYPVPDVILNWPAQGSGNYSRNLAPFIDFNNDGVYNPYDGDYPDIKGDQMLWWVFNDGFHVHTESNGIPLAVEIQCSAYAYDCPNVSTNDEAINYTTFFHYKIFNRSLISYDSVYIGKYTDTDLGNYLDDYVGCDTILNIAYTYNGDNNDDGINGYGYNPPMQNILYLSDAMTHFMYYNNDFSVIGNPVSAIDYYNYMHSIWKDGSHLTYGGNGHGAGTGATNTLTNYFFPSSPYASSPSEWNEINAGNTPDDRRLITSTGPFSFPAHSEKDFDVAYVWTRYPSLPNGLTTSWAKNVNDIMRVRQWYVSDSFPCNNSYIGIRDLNTNQLSFNLYPNPTTNSITITVRDKDRSNYVIAISDITGRVVRKGIVSTNRNNRINIDDFSSGVYFVRISNEENFAVKKFIKE
jgi:hypothetical protein